MVYDSLIIRARSVAKSYGSEKVLVDFNLDVWNGAIVGILGVSGSGKTTALRLIAGFEKPDSGIIEMRNEVISSDVIDRADDEIILSPPSGGTKFRYFQINPLPEGVPEDMLQEIAADAFEKVGAAHHRVDTTKHPAMHKTDTVDYIILLKGDVTLILDEEEVDLKPFDVVVQRGTNHAWVNNGNEPALLIAVLIDSDIK